MSILFARTAFAYDKIAGSNTLTGWEYIRRIRRSPAFGSIIFYPLVASLLTLSGNTQTIILLPFPIDVSVRIHLLYWSLFSLFVGTSLYTFFCPAMFIRYETHLDYAQAELKILTVPAFCKNTAAFVESRLRKYRDDVAKFRPDIVCRLQSALDNMALRDRDHESRPICEDSVAEMMLAHWKFMNRVYPKVRVLIFVFYIIGIALIALIGAASVIDVLFSYFG
jgi:hypothetical protein